MVVVVVAVAEAVCFVCFILPASLIHALVA